MKPGSRESGNTTEVVLLALLSFRFLWEALFNGLELCQAELSSCPQSIAIKEGALLNPSFGSENPGKAFLLAGLGQVHRWWEAMIGTSWVPVYLSGCGWGHGLFPDDRVIAQTFPEEYCKYITGKLDSQ